MLILTNSRRTWNLTQRSKASTFIEIYWTLNIITKDSITKTWWGTTFGGFFRKAICSALANLEKILISEPFWVIFDCLCLLTMQVFFFISLFCHNKYKIFLGCVHKIKVCAECSCFSRGFRHKQLKYNTWKPGTNILLHSEFLEYISIGIYELRKVYIIWQ